VKWVSNIGRRVSQVRGCPDAGLLINQLLQALVVRFFYDQLFVKEPGSPVPTPWHHDLTFWPIRGQQIASIWMPLDPVTRASVQHHRPILTERDYSGLNRPALVVFTETRRDARPFA